MYRVQWYPEIIISEFAPDFDVRGVCPQVVGEDGVDVAGDCGATLAEDAGDAFKLLPDVVLDVDRVAVHHLCRSKECSLELGEIRFALLLADALLLRLFGYGGYGCCLGCRLLVAKQIFIGNGVGCGAVNSIVAVDCGIGVGRVIGLHNNWGGVEVDTWFSGALVNLVDLDAVVEGVFVVFIVLVVLRFC